MGNATVIAELIAQRITAEVRGANWQRTLAAQMSRRKVLRSSQKSPFATGPPVSRA